MRRLVAAAALALAAASAAAAGATAGTYLGFEPPGAAGRLNYYASAADAPVAALIALHGHPRDADKTFDATLLAARRANVAGDTLVVAPLFQVGAARADKCRTPGVPAAQPGDLLWTCASWLAGGAAEGDGPSSFAVLDALVAELVRRWPSLRVVTIAGFSAGAQMVQHYIGFAAPPPAGVALRYAVADPGSWLYFDAERASGVTAATCPAVNRWKYGVEGLPAALAAEGPQARARYAAADIHYLAGELDSGDARGTAYKVLDKSCAANAQGPYRLQRALAYADYDRRRLAPEQQRRVVVVPGCAHDVACVFPSDAARAALFTRP